MDRYVDPRRCIGRGGGGGRSINAKWPQKRERGGEKILPYNNENTRAYNSSVKVGQKKISPYYYYNLSLKASLPSSPLQMHEFRPLVVILPSPPIIRFPESGFLPIVSIELLQFAISKLYFIYIYIYTYYCFVYTIFLFVFLTARIIISNDGGNYYSYSRNNGRVEGGRSRRPRRNGWMETVNKSTSVNQ